MFLLAIQVPRGSRLHESVLAIYVGAHPLLPAYFRGFFITTVDLLDLLPVRVLVIFKAVFVSSRSADVRASYANSSRYILLSCRVLRFTIFLFSLYSRAIACLSSTLHLNRRCLVARLYSISFQDVSVIHYLRCLRMFLLVSRKPS